MCDLLTQMADKLGVKHEQRFNVAPNVRAPGRDSRTHLKAVHAARGTV